VRQCFTKESHHRRWQLPEHVVDEHRVMSQHLGGVGDGAGRVDHVVHQHCHLALHIADEVHHLADIVRAAPLVHDGQWRIIQLLCKGPGLAGYKKLCMVHLAALLLANTQHAAFITLFVHVC
jgi:hypothetical protein